MFEISVKFSELGNLFKNKFGIFQNCVLLLPRVHFEWTKIAESWTPIRAKISQRFFWVVRYAEVRRVHKVSSVEKKVGEKGDRLLIIISLNKHIFVLQLLFKKWKKHEFKISLYRLVPSLLHLEVAWVLADILAQREQSPYHLRKSRRNRYLDSGRYFSRPCSYLSSLSAKQPWADQCCSIQKLRLNPADKWLKGFFLDFWNIIRHLWKHRGGADLKRTRHISIPLATGCNILLLWNFSPYILRPWLPDVHLSSTKVDQKNRLRLLISQFVDIS
jgi:hypothetical protein